MSHLIEQIKKEISTLGYWDVTDVVKSLERPTGELVYIDIEWDSEWDDGPRLVQVCFMNEAEYESYLRSGGVWTYAPVAELQSALNIVPDRKAEVEDCTPGEIDRVIEELIANKGGRFRSLKGEYTPTIGMVECWECADTGWVEAQFCPAPDCEANRDRGYIPLDELREQLYQLRDDMLEEAERQILMRR